MEIINAFVFNSGYCFEVHYTDVPKEMPKSERYQWFLYIDSKLIKLDFKKMDGNQRWFDNGIYLNMDEYELYYENYIYYSRKCADISPIKELLSKEVQIVW